MNTVDRVAVCSRSFSRHPVLRAELLQRYEHVSFNETGRQLQGEELISFLKGHTKAIVALEDVTEQLLLAVPELAAIGKYGVGLDKIDLEAMRRHGRKLGWVGGTNRRSVSELVLAFAIILLRKIVRCNREVLDGEWIQIKGNLLSGRTVGIIGCGNIGKDLVKLLLPFECNIIVHDILDYPEFYEEYSIQSVSLAELLRKSDVVTIHVPLNSKTKGLISAENLSLMKSDSILINTARGGIVDEFALREALRKNRLAGAAFDVFNGEPPQDSELLTHPNFVATPHIGGSAEEAIIAMGMAAIASLDNNTIP